MPFVQKYKCYLLIYVVHEKGKYDYISYDPMRNRNNKLGDMVLQSNIKSPHHNDQEYDFDPVRDTVVLLDTLKLQMNTMGPPKKSYSIALLNAKGSTISNTWIPMNKNHTIIVYPSSAGKPSFYQGFELYGMQPESTLLSKGYFYLLSESQLSELRYVTSIFFQYKPQISMKEMKQLTYAFLKSKYGSPLNDQLNSWLTQQYPRLNK